MENQINSSNNYDSLNDFNDLQKIKMLSIENSHIYLTDFDLDMINLNQDREDDYEYFTYILYCVKAILEKTENTTILNVLFNSNIDVTKVPFKLYERIFFIFYSQAALTKFIENKKFYVSFPQLFQLESPTFLCEDIKTKISQLDTVFHISKSEGISENVVCENIDQTSKFLNFISTLQNIDEYKEKNLLKKKYFYLKYENKILHQLQLSSESIKKLFLQIISCIHKSDQDELLPFSFDYLGLGGSFDHYHMGHNMLLSTALILCKGQVSIGITSSEMIGNKANKILLQSFNFRETMVKLSCEKIGRMCKVSTHVINDAAGQAGTSKNLQALVLTSETIKGGKYVNEIRKKNNLPEVKMIFANIISVNLEDNKCDITEKDLISSKMSSTSIRSMILSGIPLEKLEILYKSWTKLIIHTLKCPADMSHNWFTILRDNYMQSWRKYHDLNHILNYVSLAESYYLQEKIKDNINVMLSIWFHDSMYIPSRYDNEERSIELFLEFYEDVKRALVLKNTLDLIDTKKVSFYITCTKHHFEEDTYDDEDLNYMLDCDLYSLGADQSKYFLINEMIKYEYRHHLSEDEWIAGRKKFLEKVLAKKYIYRTDEIRGQLENVARSNIQLELESYIGNI